MQGARIPVPFAPIFCVALLRDLESLSPHKALLRKPVGFAMAGEIAWEIARLALAEL